MKWTDLPFSHTPGPPSTFLPCCIAPHEALARCGCPDLDFRPPESCTSFLYKLSSCGYSVIAIEIRPQNPPTSLPYPWGPAGGSAWCSRSSVAMSSGKPPVWRLGFNNLGLFPGPYHRCGAGPLPSHTQNAALPFLVLIKTPLSPKAKLSSQLLPETFSTCLNPQEWFFPSDLCRVCIAMLSAIPYTGCLFKVIISGILSYTRNQRNRHRVSNPTSLLLWLRRTLSFTTDVFLTKYLQKVM
jgi:hypothetical protein